MCALGLQHVIGIQENKIGNTCLKVEFKARDTFVYAQLKSTASQLSKLFQKRGPITIRIAGRKLWYHRDDVGVSARR